jgi:hypothetical protein
MKHTLLKISLAVLFLAPAVVFAQDAHQKCIAGFEVWNGGEQYNLSQNGKGEVVTANLGSGTMVWNESGSMLVDGKICNYHKQTVNDLLASWISESSQRAQDSKLVKSYKTWLQECAQDSHPVIQQAAKDALTDLVKGAPSPSNTAQ